METGAFAMFDALGISDIWRKHDPDKVIGKFEAIQNRFQRFVDGQLGGKGHPNTEDPGNLIKKVPIGFVSDTVVVPFIMKEARDPHFAVMMAARWASQVTRLALENEPAWAYRGVVTYGDFAISDRGHYFVGPAVEEAAANYERAEAALIWLAPSAKAKLSSAGPSDFEQGALTIGEHEVPLKADGKDPATPYGTYVASPFDWPDSLSDAERIIDQMLATFDPTKPRVPQKRRNTEMFLRRHLEEYRALLERQAQWARAAR